MLEDKPYAIWTMGSCNRCNRWHRKGVCSREQDFGRKTRIIQVDFTSGSHIYQGIKEEIKGLEIGVLVNNVGMKSADAFPKFLETPDLNQMLDKTINCNILSVLWMTRTVLPQMLQRKKGLIVNLSSVAGNRPFPRIVVYSATKAFVDFFSRGLHAEYESQGITVQSVMPFFVSTDMTYKLGTNILVKSAEEYACEALNTVGYTSKTNGCLSHSLQNYAVDLIPDCIFNGVVNSHLPDKFFSATMDDYSRKKKMK
ncbi:very-long-chain 3-oxoacyl-CoA reductase-like isoform X2 [Hyperolius riggenbachi]|uniref:very-long-chain 3-oxoacyl-CoA reductase-like isoform X2 n=1 Tax=Hyperolius riggenbachi TaxID=752182 RepID=UPI0035A337B5